MNKMLMTTFLVTGLALPALAADQYNKNQNKGIVSRGDMSMTSDLNVRGMVMMLDQATNTITISEYNSGIDRTFTVANQSDLRDIKTGDKVSVTPQENNENTASKIRKDVS